MNNIIIGIDPGETTGVIVATRGTEVYHNIQVLEALEIPWAERITALDALFKDIPKAAQIEAIVVESFRLYANKARTQIGNDFPSVRVIGILEAILYRHYGYNPAIEGFQNPPIHYVPASQRQRVAFLTELPKSEHIRDAYQLARYYTVVIALPPAE